MTQDLKSRTDALLAEAQTLPPPDREAFVRTQAAGDSALLSSALQHMREAGETLLASDETVGMETVALRTTTILPGGLRSSNVAGQKLGGFQIEHLLAQGGMGAVYRAIQTGDGFKRTVAVKVVKPELASEAVLQRFFQERSVLARLEHPNISRLVDAGTLEDGAPFLAMEYVEGKPIDKYFDEHGTETRARLKLFLSVCDAIQYAHQRLIIHRDIKPSNVMVSSDGIPKLLDFGIAKLLDDAESDMQENMALTTGGQAPMTPMYASPEQVRRDPVTTSTDIYSLAVLLYELLTGSLPYEFKQFSFAAVERTICETEPRKPSEAEIKRVLGPTETADRIKKQLRGDIDQILLMALRKEPDRRYLSIFQFADDIRKHLDGHPVAAQGDGVGYKVRKFVARHRAGVIAAALAVISLAGATVVSVHFARVAQEEKVIAQRRFAETRDLARYFLTDLDEAIRTGETSARRELVNKGVTYLKRLSEEAQGDPSLVKDVVTGYLKMGDIQGNPFGPNLGQPEGARKNYQAALAAAETVSDKGALKLEVNRAKKKLADLDAAGGNPGAALEAYEALVPEFSGVEQGMVLYQIGFVNSQLGKATNALASYRAAQRAAADVLAADPKSKEAQDLVGRAAERIGQTLWQEGDIEGAVVSLQSALSAHEQRMADAPRSQSAQRRIYSTSAILGDVYSSANRPREAEKYYRRAVEVTELLRQTDPTNRQHRIDWFTATGRLADLLGAQPSRRAEARDLTKRGIDTLRPLVQSGGASDFEVEQLAWLLLTTPFAELRNPAEALPLAEKASRKRGGQDPRLLDMVALATFGVGKRDEAVELEKKALALLPAQPSPLRTELETNLHKFEKAGATKAPAVIR